jgi:uncharacterized protein (DUF1778 family)
MPTRSSPQLNIRLDTARRDILDAAAFVRTTTSPKLAQELLEAALEACASEANVQAALQARLAQAALDEGKVTHLRTVRKTDQ